VKAIDSLALLTVLSDPSRLRILKALLEGPQFGEALSHRLQIAPSTVSFHLKKLASVGVVSKAKDQYYAVYSADSGVLDLTVREMIQAIDNIQNNHDNRTEAFRWKILNVFFDDGRLTRLPVQKKKRLVILESFAALFEPGRMYGENEVNEVILRF
jgi:ArsR family transcriptional regulator, arsenate/arsenite/antimonite-responsive transcriptional repressor